MATRPEAGRFRWRAFVTFYVTLSFLLLAVSGIVLYVAPPGRVAHWTHWTLGGLDRESWQALHTVLAMLFVLAGAVHLYFNWRVLWSYLRSRLAAGVHLKREITLALAATLAVVALTLSGLPPFASVMALGEQAKGSWSISGGEPPVPHAELLTLERLAATTQVPLDRLIADLEAAGFEDVSSRTTLAALAQKSGRPPEQIWAGLQGSREVRDIPAGGGYGTQTVREVCAQLDVDLKLGLERLRARGIEAGADSPMKTLAQRHGKRPHDLVEILAGT
jgi:hypothetical protein